MNFRMFLTCEFNLNIPTALIRASDMIMTEAVTGIKANILKFYNSIPSARIDKAPVERCRLYGLLAWLHAVILERKRYTPLGWTKKYEFSEADALCALDVIDEWIDSVSGSGDGRNRAHIDPTTVPWSALRTLLKESLYGGRVDDPFDQTALNRLIDYLFTVNSYGSSFPLVKESSNGIPIISLPNSLTRQALEEWIQQLPDTNPPTWIGLPTTAESQLIKISAQRIISTLATMQEIESVGTSSGTSSDNINTTTSSNNSTGEILSPRSQSEELQHINHTIELWSSSLTNIRSIIPIINNKQSSNAAVSPVVRCLARDVEKGLRLLEIISHDLNLLK